MYDDPVNLLTSPLFAAALVSIAPHLLAADLTPVKPADAGFSATRLERVSQTIRKHIDDGHIAGANAMVVRNGKIVYLQSFGMADREKSKPMLNNTILRMYSSTKLITGVAALILYDEGRFLLNDPASNYLPELTKMTVAEEKTDSVTGKRTVNVVAATRPIRVLDLMRHTAGFSYTGPRDESGQFYYQKIKIAEPGLNLEQVVRRLAQAPLHFQPGTEWEYGYNTDVLGRYVEAVSGMTLDRFFEERIFKPLGMMDSAFYVPESKWDRLATLYAPQAGLSIIRHAGQPQEGPKKTPSAFLGGQGSVSTLPDYARLCQMLLNGGELDGTRILSRKTVELLAADHLGDIPKRGRLLSPGTGFGLTVAVNRGVGETHEIGTAGEFSWGGAAGTRWWIDPKEKLIGLFNVQILPYAGLTYGQQFRQLVYQAME